jgi:O-antigen ligase
MSRFNNPKALPGLLSRSEAAPEVLAPAPPRFFENEGFRAAPPASRVVAASREERPGTGQKFCLVVLNIYLLSGCANDLIFRFTHGKAYITAACVLLLPILFLATGAPMRGLQTPTGRWLAAFALWLLIAGPFSVWRGGSANMLLNYLPRALLVCFYVAACAVTVRQVRTVVRVMGIGALFVIFSCYAFGGYVDGRFAIPDSLFYSNANELALQLLLGIIILMYAFFEKKNWIKVLSAAGILVSLSYILKTGSRGTLLATLATGVVVFLMSRRRMAVVLVGVPALAVAFILAPPDMRHRITLLVINPETSSDDRDVSANGSRMQREKLLKTSIVLTLTNPLFGVGPGQFAVKVAGDDEKKGQHSDWLGTHNSYTQVSSEAGLPAFIFYVAAIVTCMRMNYRLYRRTMGRPGLEQIAGMSFCMFLSMFAYTIAIFFFHEAYGLSLPLMAGVSISLCLAAKPVLERYDQPAV